ncbi:CocE/NonD family hydrolase, partial [Gordonia sp. (in: high G+C Gram-positive bacteria)]|uniref:CocE/NonD family hydrolase n=1 Tax=Gordonia sp. (in: high G+C Gram-positive bacteria) TaxID=84139 RepID=UPI003F996615
LLLAQFDYKWLQDRINDPAHYVPEFIQGLTAKSTDDLRGRTKELVSLNSSYRKALTTDAARVQVPTFVVGGWQDLFTNMEWRTLDQLSGLENSKKKMLMSTGEHLTNGWDTRGGPGQPPAWGVLQRAWFDKWIKGVDNGIDRYAPATSHQQGGGWVQSDSFPRPGQTHRRMYLTPKRSRTSPTSIADGSLSKTGPKRTAKWTVAPGTSTLCSGDTNRDQIGLLSPLDMCSKDNRTAERGALTFTSAPVRQATSINGAINLHLRTQVDAKDGFYSAVVSDVAPDGSSRVVTTGSMTVSIRNQMDKTTSGYAPNGDVTDPRYSLDAFKRDLVKPGAKQYLDIGMLGTDALLKRGHRLRVSVYAFNAPRAVSFGPISNDSRLKPEHVLLDPRAPSWLQVPSNRPIG